MSVKRKQSVNRKTPQPLFNIMESCIYVWVGYGYTCVRGAKSKFMNTYIFIIFCIQFLGKYLHIYLYSFGGNFSYIKKHVQLQTINSYERLCMLPQQVHAPLCSTFWQQTITNNLGAGHRAHK